MGSPTGLVLAPRRAATTCVSTSFPLADDAAPPPYRLEEYLSALEEERRKIDAFQRELPLCMQLLHDAIELYKEKLAVCKPSTKRQLCEPDRMTGGECLSFHAEACSHSQERCKTDLTVEWEGFRRIQEQAFSASSKPLFHSKSKSGGAFTPFSRDKQVIHPTPRMGSLDPKDLALICKDQDNSFIPSLESTRPLSNVGKAKPMENVQQCQKELVSKVSFDGVNGSTHSPSVRKARRCWSPELHRRFINALQQLGGSQVATPKQIRELMQVEGLTNDEVKSHLQKYRLHTRRLSPSKAISSSQTSQLVLLGGIWVPTEYTVHAVVQEASPLDSLPRQPSHLCQTESSQELCSELGSLTQLHMPPSSLCDQKVALAHSHSALQGPTGHLALTFHQTLDTGREESVGDGIESDTSSCKGCPQGFQHHKEAETDDDRSQGDSINDFQSHCMSEDEDSRGSDTSLMRVGCE